MDKRSFIKSISLGLATFPLIGRSAVWGDPREATEGIKAKALKKGDTIGLITPASAVIDEASICPVGKCWKRWGFRW